MGVVLFDFARQDTRILSDTRERLERNLAGVAPVFQSVIRHARKASNDMRREGLLAFEYEAGAPAGRRRRTADDEQPVALRLPNGYSPSAAGLAEDYQNLTEEILAAFAERSST